MSTIEKQREDKFDDLLDKAYDESVEIILEIGDEDEKDEFLKDVCEPLSQARNWRNDHNKTVPEFVNEYLNKRVKKDAISTKFSDIMKNILTELYPNYKLGQVIELDNYDESDDENLED